MSGQFAHRVYWNDNRCAAEFTFAIQVSIPQAPCALVQPINTICEIKSNGTLKSSEGTGCDKLETFRDVTWLPSPSVGKPVPNANYLSLTQYNEVDCGITTRTTEQNTFVADGNCYAVETNESFFKATCDSNQGTLSICNDAACTQCTSLLNAGTFQQRSLSLPINQCTPSGAGSIKMTCLTPSQVLQLQNGDVSTSTASAKPTGTGKSNAMTSSIGFSLLPLFFL